MTGFPIAATTPSLFAAAVPGQCRWRPEGHRHRRSSSPLPRDIADALDEILAVEMTGTDASAVSTSSPVVDPVTAPAPLPHNPGATMMAFLPQIPVLKGDNYGDWKRKIDLAFVMGEMDWVVTTPCPTEPPELVRGTEETDAA